MARQLEEINQSGELTGINIGGVDAEDAVATLADVEAPRESIQLTPQTTPPAHVEGKVYYDEVNHNLVVYNDIADVSLNVGEEQYMRVYNDSGDIIENGEACRHNGVDPTTELPMAVLAIADTLVNSRVLGVATHSIGIEEEGLLTTFGKVGGIDTSAYAAGQPMYLSDTIAGAYTNTPPDIVTQVGGVLLTSALAGSAMVSIINHIALPTLFGVHNTVPDTFTLPAAATYEDINNYQVSADVSMAVDGVTGYITAPNTGWYRLTFTTTVTVDGANPGGDAILFRLYNNTQSEPSANITVSVSSTILTNTRSASAPVLLTAGDTVVMQVGSEDSSADLTFDYVSFDLQSISVN